MYIEGYAFVAGPKTYTISMGLSADFTYTTHVYDAALFQNVYIKK